MIERRPEPVRDVVVRPQVEAVPVAASRDLALLLGLREGYAADIDPIVVSGNIGPRGDGFVPSLLHHVGGEGHEPGPVRAQAIDDALQGLEAVGIGLGEVFDGECWYHCRP